MSEQVKISVHNKYVRVDVEGDPLMPNEIESTISKAIEEALKAKLNIIITREIPVKQRATTVDFYYYGKIFSESGFIKRLALAFPEEMHHDNLDFFETTSRNRGVNFKLFSSVDEALKWVNNDN